MLPNPNKDVNKQILQNISPDSALEILKKLAGEDADISKRIEELAFESLTDIDPESIAEEVFDELNSLDIQDVWDNAGNTSSGYVEPYELASEMFEETLDSYIDDLKKYQRLSMDKEAKLTCMGILLGLYMFKKEATTEFKGYAEDDPYDNFVNVLDCWKEENKDLQSEKEMSEYAKKNFPDWY